VKGCIHCARGDLKRCRLILFYFIVEGGGGGS